MSAAITTDSTQAQVVGYFDCADTHAAVVDAFLCALRTNVEAQRIVGQTTFSAGRATATVETTADRIKILKELAKSADRRRARAIKASVAADDADEEAEYRMEARIARRERNRLRDQIESLRQLAKQPIPEGPFDAFTSVVAPALARVKATGGTMTQEEGMAFNTLLTHYELFQKDGQWWGRATVRIPTADGAADLGPFEWPAGSGGGAASLRIRMQRQPDEVAGSKKELIAELVATGRVNRAAALVLTNAFPQLVPVIWHFLSGTPFPVWVGDEWRDPRFVEWIGEVYCDPHFRWQGNGKYLVPSARRQIALSVAARKEHFTIADIAAVVPIDMVSAYDRLRTTVPTHSSLRHWTNCLDYSGKRNWGEKPGFTGIKCVCGDVATYCTRLPEVPRDLLCGCGLMPGSDVPFPREYLALQLPWDECLAEMRHSFDAARSNLRPADAAVLMLSDLLRAGAAEREVACALGVRHGSKIRTLENLEMLGFVSGTSGRPRIWSYTDEGRTRAEQLAREGYKPSPGRGRRVLTI